MPVAGTIPADLSDKLPFVSLGWQCEYQLHLGEIKVETP